MYPIVCTKDPLTTGTSKNWPYHRFGLTYGGLTTDNRYALYIVNGPKRMEVAGVQHRRRNQMANNENVTYIQSPTCGPTSAATAPSKRCQWRPASSTASTPPPPLPRQPLRQVEFLVCSALFITCIPVLMESSSEEFIE